MLKDFSDQFIAENYFFFLEHIWDRYQKREIGPGKRDQEVAELHQRIAEIKAKGEIRIVYPTTPPYPTRRELHGVYQEFMELIGHEDTVQSIEGLPR